MREPTRRAQRKGRPSRHVPTIEEETWPDEARILSVMAHGFSYDEAWHMSLRDYNRYTGLAAAWSIPEEQRAARMVRGTASSLHAKLM